MHSNLPISILHSFDELKKKKDSFELNDHMLKDIVGFHLTEGEEGGRGASRHNKEEEDEGGDRGSPGPQDQKEGGRGAAAMALVMCVCVCVTETGCFWSLQLKHTFCYLRWEEEKYEHGIKWKFLEHNGPYFPPVYQPLPDNIKFYYDGTSTPPIPPSLQSFIY